MRKFLLLVVASLGITGCGLSLPTPERLDEQSQKTYDGMWQKAVDKKDLSRQQLLDMLLLTQAFHRGVDRFELRSEKQVVQHTVIMQARHDRAKPALDVFTVEVLDARGQIVMQERYDYETLARTHSDLVMVRSDLASKKERGLATPSEMQRLGDLDARVDFVQSLMQSGK